MRWMGYLAMALIGAATASIVVETFGKRVEENFELIMFSTSLCDHCAVFDQETARIYKSNSLSKKAPLIKVNIDEYGTGKYHLREPIEVVPTFIVMNNGKEVARLKGLVDKFLFLSFIRDAVLNEKQVSSRHK